jgi:hypothetical protein
VQAQRASRHDGGASAVAMQAGNRVLFLKKKNSDFGIGQTARTDIRLP